MKYSTWLCCAGVLIAPGRSDATVFRVGPNGDYATIQAGINAAIPAGSGSNEVRVQSGSFSEHLQLTQTTGTLIVSGGWNAQFTVRSASPASTSINGTANGRILNAIISGGTLDFSHFLIVGGRAVDGGGGLRLELSGTAFAHIHDANLLLNTVVSTANNYAQGGAVHAQLTGSSALQFDHALVLSNSAQAEAAGYGAGLYIYARDNSNTIVQNSEFGDNMTTADGLNSAFSDGAGIFAFMGNASQLSLIDNAIHGNQLSVAPQRGVSSGTGILMNCATCNLAMHRNRWSANTGGAQQVSLDLLDTLGTGVQATMSSCLIEGGNSGGLRATAPLESGELDLLNLTIADNANRGIVASGTVSVSNSIAYANNGGDASLAAGVASGNNLFGLDPHFSNPAQSDYHLRAESPARDAGRNDAPGGIGLFDLDVQPRTFAGTVDIGAYEIGDLLFRDGFEQ
ncbi:MAG: choice-of-anchor Q domain-containing protein [Tahibacter sp.]